MLGFRSLEQRLRDGNGRTAPATVLGVQEGKLLDFVNDTGPATQGSGNTVDASVVLSKNKYRIGVRPEGEPEFETVVKAADDAFPASVTPFSPRTALVVLFDPADHQRVAIDVAATLAKWESLSAKKAHEQAQESALVATQDAPATPDITGQLARLADLR